MPIETPMTEAANPVVAPYPALLRVDLGASIGIWSLGVCVSLSNTQALVLLAASSVAFAAEFLARRALHLSPFTRSVQRVARNLEPPYRRASRRKWVASTLWPWTVGPVAILLAEGTYPDLVALVVGAFVGVAARACLELRRMSSLERRNDCRVLLEPTGRSSRFGIPRGKSQLWVIPAPTRDPH
jgi:hypothetical protein